MIANRGEDGGTRRSPSRRERVPASGARPRQERVTICMGRAREAVQPEDRLATPDRGAARHGEPRVRRRVQRGEGHRIGHERDADGGADGPGDVLHGVAGGAVQPHVPDPGPGPRPRRSVHRPAVRGDEHGGCGRDHHLLGRQGVLELLAHCPGCGRSAAPQPEEPPVSMRAADPRAGAVCPGHGLHNTRSARRPRPAPSSCLGRRCLTRRRARVPGASRSTGPTRVGWEPATGQRGTGALRRPLVLRSPSRSRP